MRAGARRVKVPGMPLWVGHATLELHHRGRHAAEVKISARVRVNPCRYALWWVGCRLGHATLEIWRSLYEREDHAHHLKETEGWGVASPDREVHEHG